MAKHNLECVKAYTTVIAASSLVDTQGNTLCALPEKCIHHAVGDIASFATKKALKAFLAHPHNVGSWQVVEQ